MAKQKLNKTLEACANRASELGLSYGEYISGEQFVKDTMSGGYFERKGIQCIVAKKKGAKK